MNAPVEKAVSEGIAAYEPFRAQLAELAEANDKAVFDYHSKAGNKDARSHVYKLKQTRVAVDEARKAAKAESLAYGRKVDAEAKEIAQTITDMIEVHAAPLKEIEDADLARIAAHRERIAEMEELGSDVSNMDYTAEQLGNRLRALKEDYPINATWEEFEQQAGRAKDKGVTSLESQIERRVKYEAEQAELERLRKEAEERDAKEREARIAREAAEQARKDAEAEAERNRLAAEQAAQAEREAAERRELELKLEAERAESARKDAENRAALAKQEAEREHQEKLKRAEEESKRREADKEHRRTINCEAKAALTAAGIHEADAETVIALIAKAEVPHVSIAY